MIDTGFPVGKLQEKCHFQRFATSRDLIQRDKGHCKWCGDKLTGRRTGWCSNECVSEYSFFALSSTLNRRIYERDQGICAVCGIDCNELRALVRRSYRTWDSAGDWRLFTTKQTWGPWHIEGSRMIYWDAHHIVPVEQGGGCCGPQNIVTLCLRCHKDVHAGRITLAERSSQ